MSDNRPTKCPNCKGDCTFDGCAHCGTGKWRPSETVDALRTEVTRLTRERDAAYRRHSNLAQDVVVPLQAKVDALTRDKEALREALSGLMPFVVHHRSDQRGWDSCHVCAFSWSVKDHPDGVHSESCAAFEARTLSTKMEVPAADGGPPRLEGRELYQNHVVIDGERHQVYVCYNCNIETTSSPCACGAFVRPLYAEEKEGADGTR